MNPDTEQHGYHARHVTTAQEQAAEALVRRMAPDHSEAILTALGLLEPPPPAPPSPRPGVEVCKNGHERTPENTRVRMKNGYRSRECLDCYKAWRQGLRLTPTWNPDTHCRNGHQRTPDNTYVGSDGGRRCKDCQRNAERKARERRKQGAR